MTRRYFAIALTLLLTSSFGLFCGGDGDLYYTAPGAATTAVELIQCGDSNVYTRIVIHKTTGIPRYATIQDCLGNWGDTVWYVSPFVNRAPGGIMSWNDITEREVELISPNSLTVKIMDVITGDIANIISIPGLSVLFADMSSTFNSVPMTGQTAPNMNAPHVPISGPAEIVTPVLMPTTHTTGYMLNVDALGLSNGIYFLLVLDDVSGGVEYFKTFRIGM